jgi:hypothetical protein
MADVEAQSRQPEQVVNEPVRAETQAATAALSEISTQPSKDPLQEAIQRGDNAWLNNGLQKPGELGTADYFFAAARGLGGDKPFTAMSDAEIAAQQMKGLFRTADMRIKNPDAHLTAQGALADGRLQFAYKPDKRTDNLATLTRKVDGDVNEINKTFTGRADGLQAERLYSSSKKQEIERSYDPTKNKEGLATMRSVKEGDKVSITGGFEGRLDGLKKETLNADPTGQTRIKEYSDGRREEVRVGKDGKSESKFFDSTGKPMTGEKFQQGQKALEAKVKAEKAAQPEKGKPPEQKLEGDGVTLPPLKAGWGPYQALQQLQREGKINLTPEQMKKEAARIRDREFSERGVTSFKQNEKLEFFSPKELAERGRALEKKGPETATEKPLERNTNIEQRLTDIKKALEPGAPMTSENADMIRRQLSDLTPAEIQRLKAGYDKDNPNALGDAIKDKFGKMNGGLDRHAHRWAEVEGHLNRTGQPGEDKAIKLRVDALESRWAGYDNNRSLSAIQQNTRTTLLGATEEQRKGIDSSLTKLYGQGGLSDLYEKGPGKDLTKSGWLFKTEDKFTKAVLDLTTKKGVDARTPEEQAGLLNLALQTRSIDNFREVAGKDVMTETGRKHFLENGGLDKINEKKIVGKGGATNVFSEIQRRELEDLARRGEESPVTQFKKAIGVTGNTETALPDAVKRVAEDPKLREMYLDGRELSRSKKEPATEKEKQSLEYYNELQKTFKSAHYFGSERKAQNFDSQIVNGVNGALSNGRLGELGASNWQHTSDLFKAIEGATPDQLNALFNGARIVDGKSQSDGLTDGRKSLSLGINRETNRERLDSLLDKKVAYGVELGQIADRIKDTPLGKPLDPKTMQELRDKVPTFKGMAPEKMQQVVDGYRVDQAISSKTVEPSKLSKIEQQQLVAYRNINAEKNPQEAALKGFLQGRETQGNIDGILNAPGDSAGTRDRKMNEYLQTLKPEEARSLDKFRNIRNDAVQTNVKRDLKESLGDAKDQQAVLGALKGVTPAEQERIKNDPAYQKEIRDLVDRTATNPASKMASKMILDSYAAGKPLSKAENASINALEKVANQDMGVFDRQKAVIDSLKEALRTDKDGSLAKELGSNEQVRKALELAVGGERKFNTIVKPLLETGMVSTAQMQRIYGSSGPELFKAGILDSTPQGLKHLGSLAGQADRDALLKDLTPEGKMLAEKIIKQGEVKPEDRQRAFVLGYEKQDVAIEQLKGMPAQQRIDMVRNYNKAFGSNLQEDLLKKVDDVHKPAVTLLATENQLTGEQSVVRSREAVTNSTSTWLGSQGLKYDSSVFRSLSDLNLADRQYKGQIPPDVMDKRIKDLAANLKSFEGTKEELANMIVEGVITAAAIAATPFTGGASLTALMMTARIAALSTGGGVAGSLLKAQLTGNYEHLAGDILKFGALTGANLLGGEALTAFTGLGGRAATRTVEKAFAEPALAGIAKEATPAVREQITKGLADLIQKGYTAGGVTDDAVRGMLNGIQGLSKESKEILAKGLTDNLSKGVREISTEGLRGTVDKLSRAGRTVSLDGSAAYIGDVGGEVARQAQHGKVDLGQAIVGGVNSFFMGSAARGTIDGVRAARAARHQVDRSVPVVVESGPKEVGPARTLKGPKDKVITLDPSEYHVVQEPAGLLEGPKKAGHAPKDAHEVSIEQPKLAGPVERAKTAVPGADLPPEIAKHHQVPKGWIAQVDAVEPPIAPGHMRLYRGVKPEALGTEFTAPMTKAERKLFDQMVTDEIPRHKWTKEQEAFYRKAAATRSFQDGRFFSDNIETARDYAGGKGKVIYVDVPREVAFANKKDAFVLPGKDGSVNYNSTVVTLPSETALTAREHALSPTNPYRIAEKQAAETPHARLVGRPASLERAAQLEANAVQKEVKAPLKFEGIPKGDAQPIPKLKKEDPSQVLFKSAGVEVKLSERGGFYYPEGSQVQIKDVNELKIHIGAQNGDDLRNLHAVLIPYLVADKELKGLVQEWKTLKPSNVDSHIRDTNRNKAFTIYADSPEKLQKVRERVDQIIIQHGLGLDAPIKSSIGDLVRSKSNRIGEARDIWHKGFVSVDGIATPAAVLDDAAVNKIDREYGIKGTNRLSTEQLSEIEGLTGIKKGALAYDDQGRLALKLSSHGSGPDVRGVYAAEHPRLENAPPQPATDRNALYALYREFDIEPVVTPKMKIEGPSDHALAGSWKPKKIEIDGREAFNNEGSLTFGTFNPSGIQVKNPHVDLLHARLGIDTDGAFIIDNSKNGTYIVRNIDGKQVVNRVETGFKTYIPEGAEVWLGHPSQGYKVPLKNDIPVAQPITAPLHQ